MNKMAIWLKALVAAVVTGAANSGLAVLGITTASALGVPIQKLDWKQVLAVCGSGGFVGLLAYLKKSPVPNGDSIQGKLPLSVIAGLLTLCAGCAGTKALMTPAAVQNETAVGAEMTLVLYPTARPGAVLARDVICAQAAVTNTDPTAISAALNRNGVTNREDMLFANGGLLIYQNVLRLIGSNTPAKAQIYLQAVCNGLSEAIPGTATARRAVYLK